MSKRNTKLDRAIHALGEISMLDQSKDATVIDAVKIAEQALRDIERDVLSVFLKRTIKGGLRVHINSAAGNESIARTIIPLVQSILDDFVVGIDGKPIKWGKITGNRHGQHIDDAERTDAP